MRGERLFSGHYLTDAFGRPITEKKTVLVSKRNGRSKEDNEALLNSEANVLDSDSDTPKEEYEKKTFEVWKQNPDYDSSQPFTPRADRAEWGLVGLIGKLTVVDDGTCEINGYCKPSVNGIATKSEAPTKYRVMKRINSTHIRVLVH